MTLLQYDRDKIFHEAKGADYFTGLVRLMTDLLRRTPVCWPTKKNT